MENAPQDPQRHCPDNLPRQISDCLSKSAMSAAPLRQWREVHLAMDTATSDIRAVEFTSSRDGDSPMLPDLLGQIPEDERIGTVTAGGAYDKRKFFTHDNFRCDVCL